MGRGKNAVRRAPTAAAGNDSEAAQKRRGYTAVGNESEAAEKRRSYAASGLEAGGGLRERKKARLRQQIVETALHLFRQRGYENTRVDDIVQSLEISQPTFFRYFPSKDAVLREVGRRAFARQAESLKAELSTKATTEERLRRFYETLGNVTEVGRPLWQAVILAGAMDAVRSPELRGAEAATVSLLREIIAEGQKSGEITRDFPVVHLAEFMEGLFNTVVRQWAVDLTGPHKLTERVRNAVEFFLRGAKA
jgi:AcrR family transcriptional regulator